MLGEQLYLSVLQSIRPNNAGSIQGTSPSQICLTRSTNPRKNLLHVGVCQNVANSTLPSLFLTRVFLSLTRDDLPQHHDAVTVHEGDAREAFAVLERVAH